MWSEIKTWRWSLTLSRRTYPRCWVCFAADGFEASARPAWPSCRAASWAAGSPCRSSARLSPTTAPPPGRHLLAPGASWTCASPWRFRVDGRHTWSNQDILDLTLTFFAFDLLFKDESNGDDDKGGRNWVPEIGEFGIMDSATTALQIRPGYIGRQPNVFVPEPLSQRVQVRHCHTVFEVTFWSVHQ